MSTSLRPHGLQHASLPCPLLSPGICSDSCPLSQWCYLTISSSATTFSCPQSFPVSRSFPMSLLFASGGQSIGPFKEYSGLIFPRIDWFDLLAVQRTLKSPPVPQFKSINSSALSFLYGPTLTSIHDQWKIYNFDYMDFCHESNVSAF